MAAARTVRPSTATIACEMTSHATISTALTAVLLQSNGQLEELKAQNKAHAEASDAQIEELKTELAESKAAREIEARTGSRVDYHKIVAFTALADENIRNAKKLEEVTEKLEEVSGMLTAVSQALRDGAAKQRELSENIIRVATKHKFIPFFHDIALLDHWNRLGESFPTMYRSGGCLWLAGYANRM